MHYNARPLQLAFKCSGALSWLLATAGLLAAAILALMPLTLYIKLPALLMVLLATAYHLALHAWLRLPWSCVALSIDSGGAIRISFRDGQQAAARVLPSSFVSAYLTLLNLRLDDGCTGLSLLLVPDRVAHDDFRRLRVWLRWGDQALPDAGREPSV